MENPLLNIDGIAIYDMESEKLKIRRKSLDVYLRMISGRQVCEKRGWIWIIEADFSDIDSELLARLDEVFLENHTHIITFVPPNGGKETVTSEFHLTSEPDPNLKRWEDELPQWSNVSYVFEEVRPHD